MSYKKSIIYFASGTGNTYRIAKTIDETANRKGVKTQTVLTTNGNPEKDIEDSANFLLGIAMPTHGFTIPWYVMKFLLRLPRRKETHVFMIATRAGTKAGKKVWWGLSASCLWLTALILSLKGYKVRGFRGFDMPSNWMIVHPSYPAKTSEFIINYSKEKASEFILKILSGKKNIITGMNIYDLVMGIALLPVSLGFLILGKVFMGKLLFANNSCNSCAICADNCPVGAIIMRGKKDPKPYWKYNCENCMRCMSFCPQKAVEAGHSWGVVLYYITMVPIGVYLLTKLGMTVSGGIEIKDYWLTQLIQFAYIYPSLFISYFIFHYLIRIPFINTLFTYTTLTHIYKRYKEPGTKLKEIAPKR